MAITEDPMTGPSLIEWDRCPRCRVPAGSLCVDYGGAVLDWVHSERLQRFRAEAAPVAPPVIPCDWIAQKRSGTAGTGRTDRTPAQLARDLFMRGYVSATITRDGHPVGGIGMLDGRPRWWGEEL